MDQPPKPPMVVDTNVAAGLRRFGMSEADIEALQAQDREALASSEDGTDFEVHEDNWDSLMFFFDVQTQWLYASSGLGSKRVGMNYPGVESGARLAGKPRRSWPALFADLQVMEKAVLRADAEQAAAADE